MLFFSLEQQVKSPLHQMLAPSLRSNIIGPICAIANKDVELKFKWSGKPEPVISWSKNGEKIEPSYKFETIATKDEFILLIREVSYFFHILNPI